MKKFLNRMVQRTCGRGTALKINLFILFSCLGIESAFAAEQYDISSHSSPINNSPTIMASCPDQATLNGNMTPVELFSAVTACVNKSDYETATIVFALAGDYAQFDMMRVEDKTAHQAASLLALYAVSTLNEEQRAIFNKKSGEIYKDDVRRQKLCNKIRKIGPPTYYPQYMVSHGMGAMIGTNRNPEGLVQPFDASGAWEQTLKGFMECK
jgi:hypothetical protein